MSGDGYGDDDEVSESGWEGGGPEDVGIATQMATVMMRTESDDDDSNAEDISSSGVVDSLMWNRSGCLAEAHGEGSSELGWS